MPSDTADNLHFSEEALIELFSQRGNNSFISDTCGKCHRTANITPGPPIRASWICVCGHINGVDWHPNDIIHENPDIGPSAATIKSAKSAIQKARERGLLP